MSKKIINIIGCENKKLKWRFVYEAEKFNEEQEEQPYLVKTSYEPKAKEKIFIYPEAEIPKFKIKPFCDQHKVALVKNKEKASAKFISKSYIKSLMNGRYNYTNVVSSTKFLTMFKDSGEDPEGENKELIELLNTKEHKQVYVNRDVYLLVEHHRAQTPFTKVLTGNIEHGESKYILTEDEYSILTEIYSSSNIYYSYTLLEFMNASIVMDRTMYFGIKELFKSTDTSNHVIAMETMANCNYEKSALYLLLIMREFSSQISNSQSRSHVNFKALTKYFGIEFSYVIDLDTIIDSLKKKKLLDQSILDKMMQEAEEQVKDTGDTEYFKVETVTVSEDIKKYLSEKPKGEVEIYMDDEEDLKIHQL